MLLDEPTVGMNESETQELSHILDKENIDVILIIEHKKQILKYLTQDIIQLQSGKIVNVDKTRNVINN